LEDKQKQAQEGERNTRKEAKERTASKAQWAQSKPKKPKERQDGKTRKKERPRARPESNPADQRRQRGGDKKIMCRRKANPGITKKKDKGPKQPRPRQRKKEG